MGFSSSGSSVGMGFEAVASRAVSLVQAVVAAALARFGDDVALLPVDGLRLKTARGLESWWVPDPQSPGDAHTFHGGITLWCTCRPGRRVLQVLGRSANLCKKAHWPADGEHVPVH